ncbi:MAG: alpha amylase C-terminal domain-containing protein [Planctomycetes bacterium]|nr:alpha amylase C-terminal domain-containing protein [Planctomycetota bacterium]
MPDSEERMDRMIRQRLAADPLLAPYEAIMRRRLVAIEGLRRRLIGKGSTLAAFADGHRRLGLHRERRGWVLREWAPGADSITLVGPFSDWTVRPEFALQRVEDGIFELRLDDGVLAHGSRHRLMVRWPGGKGERLPAWSRRVVQGATIGSWDAEVWAPPEPYRWQHAAPGPVDGPLLIYETHVGMAQEAARVGTFAEFRTEVLPRIVAAGYDTLQIMGLAEHPYYGSFGYQVSSFFACSSRFGTPDELKALVDAAHGLGLRVLMDLVHSHCARNAVEGISRQDGSAEQYVLPGERGEHAAWGSRCFDYGKREVLEFLLSNCRFWLEEFHVDGFRFDGVTSMLYSHHGLGRKFTDYGQYFDATVNEDALAYLTLANELIHELAPAAITIAEDVSGMPGLAVPAAAGGSGFDYRYAMGVADEWIRLVKEVADEDWSIGYLWYELTNRRRDEKTISYAESHDQALVGDQTLIFRLIGKRMYDRMSILTEDLAVDRGIALHKLIRLVTLAAAGHGYLNFMGNEFGHPEWIDFPREGNDWSHAYARRQWSLAEDELLRYRHLAGFDRALLALAREHGVPGGDDEYLLHVDEERKVLAFLRGDLVLVFNFHPDRSLTSHPIPAAPGEYRVLLDTDRVEFGGHSRQDPEVRHRTVTDRIHRHFLHLYLPARTGLVLGAVPLPDDAEAATGAVEPGDRAPAPPVR